jgi:hypothetical protein
VDGATTIRGEGGTSGSNVILNVGNKPLGNSSKVGGDGKFTISFSPALKTHDVVEIDEVAANASPGSAPADRIGPVAVTEQVTCDSTPLALPCINLPREGDAGVNGRVSVDKSGKASPSTTIEVWVNGASEGSAKVDADKGTFSMATKHTLGPYDVVGVIQASPDGDSGPVSVSANVPEEVASPHVQITVGGNELLTPFYGSQFQYLAQADLRGPLGPCGSNRDGTNTMGHWHCLGWLSLKLGSIPTVSSPQISSLTSVSSFGSSFDLTKQVSQIIQGGEVKAGLEFPLPSLRTGVLFSSPTYKASLSLSFIVGGGFITPFTSYSQGLGQEFCLATVSNSGSSPTCPSIVTSSTATATSPPNTNLLTQLQNNPQFQREYPQLYSAACGSSTSCGPLATSFVSQYHSVAFVLPDRSRLYRSYFAGFRFVTNLFDSKNCQRSTDLTDWTRCRYAPIFPGIVDLTFGQDESVTGGVLRGVVTTLSGNFPFPRVGWVRIFGSASVRLRANSNFAVLELPTNTSPVALNDPTVFLQPIAPQDQDYFRVGVGIDVFQFINKAKKSSK